MAKRSKKYHKNIRDSYEKYKALTEDKVDPSTYVSINKAYNRFLMNKCLEGHQITLPARMGTLCIQGREQNVRMENGVLIGLAPDWKKTYELWNSNPEAKAKGQRVFHTNTETDNIRYKWLWSKQKVLVENKNLYSLTITREFKRAVPKKLKEGFNNYIVK